MWTKGGIVPGMYRPSLISSVPGMYSLPLCLLLFSLNKKLWVRTLRERKVTDWRRLSGPSPLSDSCIFWVLRRPAYGLHGKTLLNAG